MDSYQTRYSDVPPLILSFWRMHLRLAEGVIRKEDIIRKLSKNLNWSD